MKRLKFSDPSTRTKILLNAGLKEGRLSVNLLQLIVSGETLNTWEEQVQGTISAINPDFAKLLSLSGCNISGESIHYKANLVYFFQQARDQLGKDYYTQEKHNEALHELQSVVKYHRVFETVRKECGPAFSIPLKAYIDFTSDLYKYKDFSKSFDHWSRQLSPRSSFYAWKRTEKVLKDFFEKLAELRKLENKYKYKTLKSDRDLWDIERLQKYTGFSYQTIAACLVSKTLDQDVRDLADQIAQDRSFEIKMLIEKYDIK